MGFSQNKRLHFASNLIPLILSGEKVSTWRLWDDKKLQNGDIVDFLESKTEKHFATAKLTNIVEKLLGKLTEDDKTGHESFNSDTEMYETYKKYYNRDVSPTTLVKIIHFELLKS